MAARLRALLSLLTLLTPTLARADGVVVLSDPRVAQYREAMSAVTEVLPKAPVIDPSAPDVAAQLKQADPSVLLAIGQRALTLVRAAMPSTPTVYCMVFGAAAVSSRTVTGLRLEVAPSSQLAQLREVDPGARRIGVIYEPHASGAFVEEASKAAGSLGMALVTRPIADPRELRAALQDIAGSVDALWLMPDPRMITADLINYLLVFTLERKIALFGFLDSLTQAGLLASVAPDYKEVGRRAARLAVELAAKPADARLPVPAPVSSPGALTVNLKTAKQLGLTISEAAIGKARQVYR